MTLPGAASIPAADSDHVAHGLRLGPRIVEMVWEDLRPAELIDMRAFENAVTRGHGARRLHQRGHPPDRDGAAAGRAARPGDFDRISRTTPVLANLRPSGKYLMEDFYYAGGLRALMREHGRPAARATASPSTAGRSARTSRTPTSSTATSSARSTTRCRARAGSRCCAASSRPDGAVIKHTAADAASCSQHRGRAVVFADRDDLARRIDDPDLDVDADDVLVLKSAGPVGAPGMPEWGALPIPKKLLKKGVRDMVRISDARMSGTSFGACVLHVSPEAARGGPARPWSRTAT